MKITSNMNTISTTVLFSNPDEETKRKESKNKITELTLKLQKRVSWTEDTIDNEHMNKKRSKSNKNKTKKFLLIF